MDIQRWLAAAVADAEEHGHMQLPALLRGLAPAFERLRQADWQLHADAPLAADPWQSASSPAAPAAPVADTPPAPPRAPRPQPDASTPLARWPIRDLAAALRARTITSEALVRECLAAIAERDAQVNAFVHVMAERALAEARDVDARLSSGEALHPLAGIPLSLKDLIDVAGVPTTAASLLRERAVATSDAAVTARLARVHAVVIGKTNLHEFAFGTTSEDSRYGPVRHPLDPTRSPGGSSGGSAAGVLAGMSVASVGTDTGGSIRIPAACCGLVGLKPTFGGVPTDGVVPLGQSLDHVGPIARTVDDAGIVFDVLRGYPATSPLPPPVAIPPSALRLGLLRDYFMDLLDDEVRKTFEEAVRALRKAGARIDEVAIPHASFTAAVYLATVLPEAAHYHAATLDSLRRNYTPPVGVRLEMSRYVLAEDYLRAQRGRDVLRHEVDAALAGRHALLLPTLPIVAPEIGEQTVRLGAQVDSVRNATLRLTQLFDLTGHPAISLPCGTASGWPVGAQLVGRLRQTRDLLKVAAGCEGVWG